MGNSHCVPQAPRRLRASFSRKPSLKGSREDGARKLAGLFGTEARAEGDTTANKIFYYIPGTDVPGLESQREHLDQPFLSVFKKGRRRVPVRNLGKVVHYAKVQLRFQHSQDVSDCYLELFPSHLYFQAHGSEGLTFQGLLPLVELSICPLEGTGEHAFQITGPLPAPLLVVCPSQAELDLWLYHLEKQTALLGGPQRCHSAPPQDTPEDELPWSLQHRLTQLRTAGRPAVGGALCASRVKLQHLPSQEQWDRLLVLYPASLAIFSEEADGLCFKGELPLSAIHINLEEKGKQIRSFLIEGRLINTIRVLCASYEDYSHWLLCLQTVSRREGAPLLPGPESLLGLRGPAQVLGSGRGSLSSDGQTSWDSGCPAPASARTSRSLPEYSAPSTAGPAPPAPDQANSGCTSISRQKAELRRGGSSRSPRSKARGEGPGSASPLHLDLTKVTRLSLEGGPEAPDHSLETPHSPLYTDPYTPPATSHHKIREVQGLDEFLAAMKSSRGPSPSSPFPSVPVSVPVSDPSSAAAGPHPLSRKGALQGRASQRHRGSAKGREPRPPDSPQLVSPSRDVPPKPLLRPPDGECPRSYDNVWDKPLSPPHQRWPRGATEAEGELTQWI
ncbi:pleckstrin homology domain-containing family N member 1 isoform X1 [Pteronotus mesoamericanus]|uniref:pleckstrin homology domain-containing family N member 1 isoform X1 n=1 Tax=Pteronotus mesoamericanus TaxID=1884717 RepID=UPI0023EBD6E2|nr:pleckstrin homology domain-containing family N member 1 isoform X1 [Pteronotus parnellii mesoamericanus]